MSRTARRGERLKAPMQNAEGRMQNFLGDGAIEVQTVGDDVTASQIMKSEKQKYGSNEAQTVGTGVPDCP